MQAARIMLSPRATRHSVMMLAVVGSSVACESRPQVFTEPMMLGGREVAAETLNHGRDLYRVHCVSCHGESGTGDGPAARSLAFSPRDFRTADFASRPGDPGDQARLPTHEELVDRIRQGVPERGMPMWKGMREQDLSALADYIKTFSPRWQEASP